MRRRTGLVERWICSIPSPASKRSRSYVGCVCVRPRAVGAVSWWPRGESRAACVSLAAALLSSAEKFVLSAPLSAMGMDLDKMIEELKQCKIIPVRRNALDRASRGRVCGGTRETTAPIGAGWGESAPDTAGYSPARTPETCHGRPAPHLPAPSKPALVPCGLRSALAA